MLALSSFAAGNQMLRSFINTGYMANLIRVLTQDIKIKTWLDLPRVHYLGLVYDV